MLAMELPMVSRSLFASRKPASAMDSKPRDSGYHSVP